MDREQLNASLVWFAVSLWLSLTLMLALYFVLQLFMDADAAGGQTAVFGFLVIMPMAFIGTMPYALRISRWFFRLFNGQ